MNSEQKKRAFVGTRMQRDAAESARLSGWIDETVQEAELRGWRMRGSKSEKLHITWRFLGDIDSEEERLAKEALAALAREIGALTRKSDVSIERKIVYESLTVWEKPGGAVIVLSPPVVPAWVSEAGASARRLFAGLGNTDESVRRNAVFMPHLTVLRCEGMDEKRHEWLSRRFEAVAPVVQFVNEVELTISNLESGEYTTALLSRI